MTIVEAAKSINYGNFVKLEHYFEAYEDNFWRYQNLPIRILEIGVKDGGSLRLWRNYFWNAEKVYGLDINIECIRHADPDAGIHVIVGSAEHKYLLEEVATNYGPFDIIIDDGSHLVSHQILAFQTLFPLLAPGGTFVIEDLHTSYWPHWQGGGLYTTITHLLERVHDLNWWAKQDVRAEEYRTGPAMTTMETLIKSISFYDSMAFIRKVDKLKNVPLLVRKAGEEDLEYFPQTP